MPLILDTSVLLAALDERDADHDACAGLISATPANEALIIADTVAVELHYWVTTRLGRDAWASFIEDMVDGAYAYDALTLQDIVRASEVDRQYEALNLGLVDASLVALAERLREERIATLNLRDFRAVVPKHAKFFRLLPADS